jgi:photosystem II stability/assembly factor-like uncharacterized protein
LTWSTSTSTDGARASRLGGWRLRRWQVVSVCLVAVVVSLGLIGGGVLGAWQGLSENATNMVTAAAAGGVPVTSVHCSGLSSAYPATCTDTQGTVTLSWTKVAGSTGITVERATSPTGTYATIATLAGTATTYTDTTAAYNTQYYYEVFSGAAGWVLAADVDMALSLPPTGGVDDTVGTGGTAFSSANLAAMALAGDGKTYTTTTSWGSATTTVLDGEQVNGLSCASATQCWAVTASGDVWATTDGGNTWTEEAAYGGQELYGIDMANASDGWAVGGNKENIYATTNGGATWSQQNSHPGATFYAVAFANANDGWVVGSGGLIWVTTNGGSSWSAQASGTAQQLDGLACVSASQCWAVGTGGVILATSNGGATWTAQTSGTGNNLNGVSCVSATQCWVVGGNGELLVTSNGGSTWTAQTSRTGETLNAVSMVSASTGWAVGVGGRHHLDSAGIRYQPAHQRRQRGQRVGRDDRGHGRRGNPQHPADHQRREQLGPGVDAVRAVGLRSDRGVPCPGDLGRGDPRGRGQPVPQLDRPDLPAGLGELGVDVDPLRDRQPDRHPGHPDGGRRLRHRQRGRGLGDGAALRHQRRQRLHEHLRPCPRRHQLNATERGAEPRAPVRSGGAAGTGTRAEGADARFEAPM